MHDGCLKASHSQTTESAGVGNAPPVLRHDRHRRTTPKNRVAGRDKCLPQSRSKWAGAPLASLETNGLRARDEWSEDLLLLTFSATTFMQRTEPPKVRSTGKRGTGAGQLGILHTIGPSFSWRLLVSPTRKQLSVTTCHSCRIGSTLSHSQQT